MFVDFSLKEKIKELKTQGGKTSARYFDLGVGFWLLNPDEKEYTAEYLSKKFLHKDPSTSSGQEIKEELYKFAQKKLKEYKLEGLFYDVEMPLMEVLADMEVRGIKLNVKGLKDLDKELQKKLNSLTKAIYKDTGETFNINSPKQLGQILFQKLNF